MNEIQRKAKELLDSISREELIELLTDSGIKVTEGSGKVLYAHEVPFVKTVKVKAKIVDSSKYKHDEE